MPKTVKILLVLILALILTVAFFRHRLCRLLIIQTADKAAGVKLSIQDLELNVLNSSLYMRGITVANPQGFKNLPFSTIEEIFIKYNLRALLSGRVHLRQAKARISEINIIRNEKGQSNLSILKTKQARSKETSVKPPSAVQKKADIAQKKRPPRFLIDNLELSLGKATFMNYQAGIGEAAVIIFTIKGPLVYKNVSDLGSVFSSISVKAGFANLLNNLALTSEDILQSATKAIRKKIEDALPEQVR
jgi:uncharacterized protein involved in outer membrane biogenesis